MVSALLLVASLAATPPAASRDDIVNRAKTGVGYSYHWGGGCWQSDGGGGHGSCVGNCPNCTHSGTYGADCSGFVFKNWQIDGAQALTTCDHGPYTANSYHVNSTHWTHITRADAKAADILASTEHVVIIESGDPWGTPTIMEARGCSYGVQRNVRSIGSDFNASQRDNLTTAPPPAWKATFVSQTFPYASAPAIELKEGDTVDGNIVMKNAGTHAWNDSTKLAPTPRDQASLFADPSWLSPTRVVSPGTTAVNGNGTFAFTLKAGSPGEHYQTFGLVQEAVSWFADSGGPVDNQLEVRVHVSPRDHAGELVGDGFTKDDDGAVEVEVGSTVSGYLDVKNDGHVAWDDTVKLAPVPRDQASAIAAASWLSPTRVATPDATTVEGDTARFTFEVQGGSDVGEVTQQFGLVHEGVTWFADAGYGPADGFFTLTVKTIAKPVPPPVDPASEGEASGGPDEPDPNVAVASSHKPAKPSVQAGCAQSGAATPLFALLAMGLVRRRRSAAVPRSCR